MTDDVMDKPWCCLVCFAKFKFGEIYANGARLECPKCRHVNIHPADNDRVGTLEEYHGDKGTIQ